MEKEMDDYKEKYMDYFLNKINEINDGNGIEVKIEVDSSKDE